MKQWLQAIVLVVLFVGAAVIGHGCSSTTSPDIGIPDAEISCGGSNCIN